MNNMNPNTKQKINKWNKENKYVEDIFLSQFDKFNINYLRKFKRSNSFDNLFK